jgi:hypothetical protein
VCPTTVRLYIDSAAVPAGKSAAAITSAGFSPPPQTTVRVMIVVPSLSSTLSLEHLLDHYTEMQLDTVALQAIRGIGMGLVRERCEQHITMINR